MASTDATAIPIKNQAYRVTFPVFDADGDLVTGAGSLDSEISKDGGTFADCTNEATEIATSSGMYYLDLTSTEMNADTVAIIVKSASGKTTPIVMYPAENADIKVNVVMVNGTSQTARDLGASVLLSSGTGTGQVSLSSGAVTVGTNNDKTGYGLADGAITAAKIQDGALTAAKFASGAFDAVWTVTTRLLTAGTNIVLAKGTGLTGLNDIAASDVNTQVLDVLTVDTFAEPTSVPAATSTLKDKISWLFVMARNKRVTTSTLDKVRNDADDADIATSDLSDDGSTFTKGEYTSA